MPMCWNDWPNVPLQLPETFKIFPGSKADSGTDVAQIVFTQSRGWAESQIQEPSQMQELSRVTFSVNYFQLLT